MDGFDDAFGGGNDDAFGGENPFGEDAFGTQPKVEVEVEQKKEEPVKIEPVIGEVIPEVEQKEVVEEVKKEEPEIIEEEKKEEPEEEEENALNIWREEKQKELQKLQEESQKKKEELLLKAEEFKKNYFQGRKEKIDVLLEENKKKEEDFKSTQDEKFDNKWRKVCYYLDISQAKPKIKPKIKIDQNTDENILQNIKDFEQKETNRFRKLLLELKHD